MKYRKHLLEYVLTVKGITCHFKAKILPDKQCLSIRTTFGFYG